MSSFKELYIIVYIYLSLQSFYADKDLNNGWNI